MRLRATCKNCGREVFSQQILDGGGHCPWCGIAFAPQYTSVLVRALREVEQSANRLQESLDQIAELEALGLDIDDESVLQPLREALTTRHGRGARV